MKFTNVKQLIIKFMGGGLINFPTRFLRWVKINGDVEGSDDGGGGDEGGGEEGNSNIFFSPLAIQPSYYGIYPENDEDNIIIHEIQDIANTIGTSYSEVTSMMLFYSKEQVINLGISENILNNLQQVTYPEFMEDLESGANKCHRDDENLNNITYNNYIIADADLEPYSIHCERFAPQDRMETAIYKFGDDIYFFTNVNTNISPDID